MRVMVNDAIAAQYFPECLHRKITFRHFVRVTVGTLDLAHVLLCRDELLSYQCR